MHRLAALFPLLLLAASPVMAQSDRESGFTPRPAPTAILPQVTPLVDAVKDGTPATLAPLLPLPVAPSPLSPVVLSPAALPEKASLPPPAPPPLPTQKMPEAANSESSPSTTPDKEKKGEQKATSRLVHTKDDVFLRATPGGNGKILDALKPGVVLELRSDKDNGDWVQVFRNGKALGYVAKSYLIDRAPGQAAATQPPKAQPATPQSKGDGCATLPSSAHKPLHEGAIARALTDTKIRQSPACNAKVLDILEEDDKVTVIGLTGAWYHVARKGRTLGYISAPLLAPAR